MKDELDGAFVDVYLDGRTLDAYRGAAELTYHRWREEGRDMDRYSVDAIMRALVSEAVFRGTAGTVRRERRLDKMIREA